MLEYGYTPYTKLIQAKELKNGYSLVVNGRRYTIKEPVYKIIRLRYANDIPMMLEERYISLKFCKDIQNKNFESSLYDIYEKIYGYSKTVNC